jgi:RNA polymerase II subunit A-like phosphatase
MKIVSPSNLHYPVTIVELERKRDDEVKRSTPLFRYYYESTVTEATGRYDETHEVKRRFPSRFHCQTDGVIKEWYIKAGSVIEKPGYDIEPPTGGIAVVDLLQRSTSRN